MGAPQQPQQQQPPQLTSSPHRLLQPHRISRSPACLSWGPAAKAEGAQLDMGTPEPHQEPEGQHQVVLVLLFSAS